MNDNKKPQLGQVVKVLRGRDIGKYAIIVAIIDQRCVMIVDGNKRKFDQPKKKNVMHLQLQQHVSQEIITSLLENGRVTNGKLRFALEKFADSKPSDADGKGE